MKIHLLSVLFLISLFAVGANAQDTFGGRDFAGIKSDFNQVKMVAHVKIKDVQLASSAGIPLYRVESEVVESFKGALKKGQALTFFFNAEEGYNPKPLIGKEWVAFLEKESPIPPDGKANGWYELENSKIPASKALSKKLRKLKKG